MKAANIREETMRSLTEHRVKTEEERKRLQAIKKVHSYVGIYLCVHYTASRTCYLFRLTMEVDGGLGVRFSINIPASCSGGNKCMVLCNTNFCNISRSCLHMYHSLHGKIFSVESFLFLYAID